MSPNHGCYVQSQYECGLISNCIACMHAHTRRFIEVDNQHDECTLETAASPAVQFRIGRGGALRKSDSPCEPTAVLAACTAALELINSSDSNSSGSSSSSNSSSSSSSDSSSGSGGAVAGVSAARCALALQYRQERARLLQEAVAVYSKR
eukprot:21325-Heterococcus_DN1.PRE.3